MSSYTTIYIVDDHPLMCQGIKSIIDGCDNCKVIKMINDPYEALEAIRSEPPDIVIMDISMGKLSGLEILKNIDQESIPTKVIILTMHKEKAFLVDAIDHQVSGYLLKDSVQDELIDCIKMVISGERYFSSNVWGSPIVISDYLSILDDVKQQFNNLTQSEKNVIHLISKNMETRDIASHLFISPKTVENHRGNICKKLKISGKNALLKWVSEYKRLLDFKIN